MSCDDYVITTRPCVTFHITYNLIDLFPILFLASLFTSVTYYQMFQASKFLPAGYLLVILWYLRYERKKKRKTCQCATIQVDHSTPCRVLHFSAGQGHLQGSVVLLPTTTDQYRQVFLKQYSNQWASGCNRGPIDW